MLRLWLSVAVLAATHSAAHAYTDCLDRLLASLAAPTDVSVCNLLSLTDGRVVAVRTEHGLFVQTKDGKTSTHYLIDAKRHDIGAQHFARRHTYPPMDRVQPDAKQYYYPFYGPRRGGGMSGSPRSVKFVCQSSTKFLFSNDDTCPGWEKTR